MRKVSALLLLPIAILMAPTPAQASVKAGGSCAVVGQRVSSHGTNFICTLTGKKKTWKSVKTVVAAKPTVAPTPIASAKPTTSPTPTATPTPKASSEPTEPANFDDLIANPKSAPYWAWKKSSLKIAQSKDEGPSIVMHVGPHTTLQTSKTSEAIVATTRLYSGYAIPSTVHAIYYSYEDIAWGQSEFAKLALRPSGQEAARQCQTPQTCWGALAEIDMKGNGILLISSGVIDSNHTSGTLEAHEFAHTIQGTQFVGTSKSSNSYCCVKAYLPHWTVEGGAEFAQAAAIFSNSFDEYLQERTNDTAELLNNYEGKFTVEWLKSYIAATNNDIWNDPKNSWRMYDVGFLVNEAFVAIKGPDISMKLNKDVANGASWEEAFQSNFGISWTDAVPKIVDAVKAQLKK